ncbi:MAG: hypothetical protein FWD83_00350 [Promicromonosporaceae bacterium]|nr:hypothetical protein [Promicromonosporaceae bacterium]
MSDVALSSGSMVAEVVPVASAEVAREVTTSLKSALVRKRDVDAEVLLLVQRVEREQMWRALGYESITAYCEAELSDIHLSQHKAARDAAVLAFVAMLVADGHSPATVSHDTIAAVYGVSAGTVRPLMKQVRANYRETHGIKTLERAESAPLPPERLERLAKIRAIKAVSPAALVEDIAGMTKAAAGTISDDLALLRVADKTGRSIPGLDEVVLPASWSQPTGAAEWGDVQVHADTTAAVSPIGPAQVFDPTAVVDGGSVRWSPVATLLTEAKHAASAAAAAGEQLSRHVSTVFWETDPLFRADLAAVTVEAGLAEALQRLAWVARMLGIDLEELYRRHDDDDTDVPWVADPRPDAVTARRWWAWTQATSVGAVADQAQVPFQEVVEAATLIDSLPAERRLPLSGAVPDPATLPPLPAGGGGP